MKARAAAWTLLLVVVVGTALVRVRLLDVPLDRDEGEYAYAGQLLLDGVAPYAGAYNVKLPGTYGAYAAILAVFGQTTAAVHAGLLVVTVATAAGVYALAAALSGPAIAAASAATYAVLSLSPALLGHAAYAEHFVVLPVVLGAIALVRATRPEATRRALALVASGMLFGLGVLMKQSGAGFALAGAVFALLAPARRPRERLRAAALFTGGALLPLLLLSGLLVAAGTFPVFWFWMVVYGSHYGAPLAKATRNLVQAAVAVVPSCWVILGLAGVGVVRLLREHATPRRNLVLLLLGGSALGAAAGLHFREHYFLLMVPPVAMAAAVGVASLARRLGRGRAAVEAGVAVVLLTVALAQPLYAWRAILFTLPPDRVSREIYGRHPFPESVAIGRFIREHSAPGDRVAVVGSEPQIYFHAGRRAATGYLYTFALMERQPYASAMQQQMVREIEATHPRYLVFVSANLSWLVGPESDRTIFAWFNAYQRSFQRVGVADVVSLDETVYRWGDDARTYRPRSDIWLMVLERER